MTPMAHLIQVEPNQAVVIFNDLLAQVVSAPSSLEGVRLIVGQIAQYTQFDATTFYSPQTLVHGVNAQGRHEIDEKWTTELIAWADTLPAGIHEARASHHPARHVVILRDTNTLVGVLLLTIPDGLVDSPLFSMLSNLLCLNAAKLRAEDARARYIKNQDQFVTDFVHDLRTPMTVVKSTADIVEGSLTRSGDTTYSKMLKRIMANIDAISDLLEHVFVAGIYDPDTGKYTLSREAVDLDTIISVIIKNLTAAAQKKELSLKATVDRELPILSADKSMITRALTNLVDNAVKYTNHGEVEVRVEKRGDSILIAVRDTGVGLSEEAKRHVFDKFFRDNNRTHGSVKGTGLGLFIVQSAAIHHGGKAWVESELERGSTFYLTLPLKPAEPALS